MPSSEPSLNKSRRNTRRAATAGVVGSVLEYYDFAIYGLAAALVFGPVFFPATDPTTGLLASFATFGVGFLARPLGGIVFGRLGDRIGRKKVLITTVMMMGVATVLIGCLPGYATLGPWAGILLVVLRLVQGFAFGGEYGGAILIVSEHADSRRRGMYAALPGAGLSLGLIVGNLAFLAVSQMDPAALMSWGWRVPFWAGGVLVIVGLVMRRGMAESPEFERNRATGQVATSPLREAFRTHLAQILLTTGVLAGVSVTTYISVTYSLSYAKQQGVSASLPLLGVLIASALHLVLVPAAGALSDRIGRLRTHLTGVAVIVVMMMLFLPMIATGSGLLVILAYLLLYGVGWGTISGVFPAMLSEAFDSRVRYSGMSIGIQLGNIVGGFTPFAATLVVASTGGTTALAIGLAVIVLLSGLCATAMVRRTAAGSAAAEESLVIQGDKA